MIFKLLVDELLEFEWSEFDGELIKLLECNSFSWTLIGNSWVACLDPNIMDIQIGTTQVYFSLDLGCLSFTVPQTRIDGNGNVIQEIFEDQALAANLSTLSVNLALEFTPPHMIGDYFVEVGMKKIFKETYSRVTSGTSCGKHGSWGTPIASCNSSKCPNGSTDPIYSDDFIEVTEESLLGQCF